MLVEAPSRQKDHLSTVSREIFFIDDDEEELVIFNLAMKGIDIPFNLHYGKNGDHLFKLIAETIPSLIFLDLHMPGKSGITVLKMLRFNKKYDSVPIVIYSKLNKVSFVDDCYASRANYYLIKPVSVRKLTNALHKIIETNWDAQKYPSREEFIIEEF